MSAGGGADYASGRRTWIASAHETRTVWGRRTWLAMVLLATLGLGVASYLTYVHYSGSPPACTAGASCLKVQTSVYSKLAGVPVALIGLLGYVAILASLLAPEGERSRFAAAALTLGGFGFSAYLTYRELFSIHAICEWCVSSACIMTLLMALATWRFLTSEHPRTDQEPAAGGQPSVPRRAIS